MAQSQDLLVARNWQGVLVSDVVRSQLAPFADEVSQRIRVHGPPVELKADAVHSITLALHELATNAAKYGALSVPQGQVNITWELAGSGNGERLFRLNWREERGPPVRPPERKGFGHIVVAEMVASSLRGKVALEFPSEGLTWTLEIPGGHVANEGR
jgi:two-component system CheB/CheR fusion protein